MSSVLCYLKQNNTVSTAAMQACVWPGYTTISLSCWGSYLGHLKMSRECSREMMAGLTLTILLVLRRRCAAVSNNLILEV